MADGPRGHRPHGLGGSPAQTQVGHGAVAWLRTPDGRDIRLVGCYHVSQRNTFTGLLTEQMLDDALALAAAPVE